MQVSEIHRYPVKSMGGEALSTVAVDRRGLVGDRWFAVTDEQGHLASGKNTRRFRRHDAVFGFRAVTDTDAVVVRRGYRRWVAGDPELDEVLSTAFGVPARVLPEGALPHQDGGQVSLVGTASLRWCREHLDVDADPRRLRANLVVDTADPFVEESWGPHELAVGEVLLRPVKRIERCRMIDLAQDGVETEAAWLKTLARTRDLRLGVYADVVTAGAIRVGDEVR